MAPGEANDRGSSIPSTIKIEDADLENGYVDEPSIMWTVPGDSKRTDLNHHYGGKADDASSTERTGGTPEERTEQAITTALFYRKFHIPGNNSWGQDWKQYMLNTHPVLALCCADKRSGFDFFSRLCVFGTSIAVSFAAVNCAFWWKETMEARVGVGGYASDIPLAMIYLWTWMSALHAIHDCVIWYGCLCPSRPVARVLFRLLWFWIWVAIAAAAAGLLFAGALYVQGEEAFEYRPRPILKNTAIELALSWVFWYPLISTIIFSGVLGCGGHIPILGGRPRDIRKEQERNSDYLNHDATNMPRQEQEPVTTLQSLSLYDQSTKMLNRLIG